MAGVEHSLRTYSQCFFLSKNVCIRPFPAKKHHLRQYVAFSGRPSVITAPGDRLKEKITPSRVTAPGYKVPSHKVDPARKALQDTDSKVDNEEAILLQGFGWGSCESSGWWKILAANISRMKDSGATHVWLPPPSQSVAKQGYLPGQLYNLDSAYGTMEQLKELVTALKAAGLQPIADIVINHRCADEQGEDGIYNNYKDDIDHNGKPIDWGKWAITGDDPIFGGHGALDTGEDYGPAPDLDHTNKELRQSLIEWMNWLKDDIGFQGWRFDFVKGYAPRFIDEYVSATVGHEALNIGEFWVDLSWGEGGLNYDQNQPRQVLCDWLDNAGGATLFDFPTKGILQEAVKNCEYWRLKDCDGNAPGLLGWWPSKAVTFIDNHDTGSTQQHWPFPGFQEETGYAYIMTHPGVPTILWEHLDSEHLAGKINELSAIRKRNGIRADSNLDIRCADADLYVAAIGDKLILKLGPRMDLGDLLPKESDGWKVASTGKDYAVWEKV